MPCVKLIVCRAAGFGLSKALGESTQASSGMDSFESSVSRPPTVTPHRPRLTE